MAEPVAIKTGLPPVIDRRTRVLILGSLPSDESLRKRQYYGNPRNRFWILIGAAVGRNLDHLTYEQRIEYLLKRGVGLWDVHARAKRPGSADSKITNARLNDFSILKDRCPKLKLICFNGQKAAAQKKTLEELGYRTMTLLSSSSANPGRDKQRLNQWRNLALFLTMT